MQEDLREEGVEIAARSGQSQGRISFKQAVSAMKTKLAAFYRQMAEVIPKARSKAVLKFLAEEEEKQAVGFQRMSDVETSTEALNRAFESAGPIMRFLVEDLSAESLAKVPNTELEILKIAIRCEKDSILFFHELMRFMDDQPAIDQIQKMIEIEYEHLNQLYVLTGLLTREIKAYKRPQSGRLPRAR